MDPLLRVECPMWEICKPFPFPTFTLPFPLWSEWRERLAKSGVMWFVAPVSGYHISLGYDWDAYSAFGDDPWLKWDCEGPRLLYWLRPRQRLSCWYRPRPREPALPCVGVLDVFAATLIEIFCCFHAISETRISSLKRRPWRSESLMCVSHVVTEVTNGPYSGPNLQEYKV